MNDYNPLQEIAKAGVNAFTASQRPTVSPYRPAVEPTVAKFHKENSIVGVDLQDYTSREPSDDGTYVKVTIHRERIELVEQPPTPEEIAEQKEQRKHSLIIGGIVAAGLLGVAGILQALDHRQVRGQVTAKAQTKPKPSGS